jgi:dihydroorotate dehydrogenase (fumarate)
MLDLTTTYLGLPLRTPLVASASPLSKALDSARRLEDAGAAAIVMYSLFEEQITHESRQLDHYLSRSTHAYAEALSYFPDLDRYNLEPDAYVLHLRRLKESLAIPVIGSLNGVTAGGWIDYATWIEQAGADALELNIYYLPTDPFLSSAELEDRYIELVRAVRARVAIPLALKLSPAFTGLPNMARRFAEAGADGLVLFNRFYQPDLDLVNLEVVPGVTLSTSADLRLPLRWVAILAGRVQADLALSGGVHTAEDALKALMAGANVAMLTSALLEHGPGRLLHILSDMRAWMEEREYESVEQLRGSMSQRHVAEPAAFERANYMRALTAFDDHVV